MKTIYEHDIGGDGAKAKASAGVEGTNLKVAVEASYPLDKIASPALKVVDNLIDKIEQWIPGDQTGMAAKLKAEAHAELIALLSESLGEAK